MATLISQWKAENNLIDSVSGINGTCVDFFGTNRTMDYTTGYSGYAFDFIYNGSNPASPLAKRWYCDYGTGDLIKFNSDDSFSIFLYFKISNWPTYAPTYQLLLGDSVYNNRTWEIILSTAKKIRVSTQNETLETSELDIELDTWYKLLITHDGSDGNWKIYVDSILKAEGVLEYLRSSNFGYTFGGHQGGTGSKYFLSGALDEISIYDGIYIEETRNTHTVVIEKGLIKSWAIVEGGELPATPNTHEIIIEKGLIKEWNISSGGSRPSPAKNHIVSILKGLVKSWEIT